MEHDLKPWEIPVPGGVVVATPRLGALCIERVEPIEMPPYVAATYDPDNPIMYAKTVSLDEARRMFPEHSEMPVEVMAADGAFDPDAWLAEFNRAVARNCATVPRPPKGWRMVYDYSVIVYWAHGYGPKVVGLERGEDTTSYFREEGDVS